MPWPNFLLFGAPKSGTSALYRYVGQHPDVYVSPVKEPHYFKPLAPGADTRFAAERIGTEADYLALFDGVTTERAIGEGTPSYLQSDASADLIRAAVPDVRLVAVLRNPVDRAFSDYLMRVGQGTEDLSFADAVALERAAGDGPAARSYLRTGFYGRHLTAYLERFPREQLAVHLSDDLARDPVGVASRVFAFLGVDPGFAPEIAEHNVTRHPVRSETVDRVVRHVPGKSLARRLVPSATWTRARRWVRRRNSRPEAIDPDLRRTLTDMYRDDVSLTAAIIGRDLSHWLSGSA